MTDSEAARLTRRQASVEVGRARVWATSVQAGIAEVGGLIQCALMAWGLTLMRQSARQRDQQQEEHMPALKARVERPAP